MRNKDTDISLIQKYLDGELDAKAMHQLERRAQHDPFLMDALEGYEHSAKNQTKNLDDITRRINQRLEQKERRIIPFRTLGIAASILLVCSVGVWWLRNYNDMSSAKLKTAQLVKPEDKVAPVANDTAVPEKPSSPVAADADVAATSAKRSAAATPQIKTPSQLKIGPDKAVVRAAKSANVTVVADAKVRNPPVQDTTPLNEAIVMGYTNYKKDSVLTVAKVKKITDSSTQHVLPGQAKGVSANNVAAKPLPAGVVFQGRVPGLTLNEVSIKDRSRRFTKNLIKGTVVAGDDKLPIPGASVKIAGTNISTVTDANGRFSLSADSSRSKLLVGYIGYQTHEINAHNRDSLKSITLAPTNSSLNEVVVTGYSTTNGAVDNAVISAHPQNGWRKFRKYIREKAISPDKQKGTVKLSFEVGPTGKISNVKVIKGISAATDQAAINLINNGPAWAGNSAGQTDTVKVRVKFEK